MAGLRVVRIVNGEYIQAVSADHAAHLGTSATNSDMSVAAAAATNSSAATRSGLAMITLPPGAICRCRVGVDAIAVATDHLLTPGLNAWPIKVTERVSLFGLAGITTFTATVSMALADGPI